MRHVEHCMGTAFTIVIADEGDWRDDVADVVAWLHRVDGLFSTYLPGSEISRLRRGELQVRDTDPLVGEVLGLCARYAKETDGWFTHHLPGGLDPTGLVKGWAVERASELLRLRGSANHAVSGGGDMQLAGESAPGRPWRVGIADPLDATRLVHVVTGRDLAVATSGTAERGQHITDPRTGRPAEALASVTVVGRSLTRADVYATAAFAMGGGALRWLESRPAHEGLVVGRDGTARRTSLWGVSQRPVSALAGALVSV